MAAYKQNLPFEFQNLKIEIPVLSTIVSPPPKPTRCCHDGCKKKLSLTDFPCKCGKIHCGAHRVPEVHNCTFDFKQNHKEILLQHMSTAVTATKIDSI